MGQQWRAAVYSQSIADDLFERGARFRMQSVYEQACNLVTARGNLVTLVAPALGNGPFHVTVPADLFAAVTACDRLVNPTGKRLEWGGYSLDLSAAASWSPLVHWPATQLSDPVRRYVNAVADELSLVELFCLSAAASPFVPEPLLMRAEDGIRALRLGFKSGGLNHFRAGASALGGLGPGLTPAGDDLLVGLMAGLWYMESILPSAALFRQRSAATVCQVIGDATRPQTTFLSGLWLAYAMQNQFSEPWHRLAKACASDELESVARDVSSLLAVGATSGRAAFYGFALAIDEIQ